MDDQVTMTEQFVHLHTHSEYSLLDGLGRIKRLVAEAKRLGQPALALTDHGTMHGVIEFFRSCRSADIRPVIGVEAYQTVWGRPMDGRDARLDKENYHLLLLAKSMQGYRNLLKISSRAQLDGYYYKPRIDHDFLAAHSEGIICTTGCLGAEVPQLLMQGKEKEAYERLGWYVDVFGRENFFIEIQEHNIAELIEVNRTLVPWADKFGLALVVTNDVHYVREEDGGPHDILLCVQTGARVNDQKRMRMSDGSYFLKSRAQMEETFRPLIDLPESAFSNSVRIAEMCEVDLEDSSYHLPEIDIPDGFTYETYLRYLTEEGLRERYGERANDPAVQARKEHELKIIHQMGFDVYFVIVWDLCREMKQRNIWWNVRGSGAGSIVAYAAGITLIDPLEHSLIFERFLNPGRISMPDFDLDIPDDSREEMIQYTVEKYGPSSVAQIVAFGRMKARAAIRDIGRAQDISLGQVDRIAKMIPAIPGKPITIQDVLTEGHEFYNPELVALYQQEAWVRELLDTSMQLEGVARHASTHAAAVIITDKPLTEYLPIMRPQKAVVTESVTQFEFPVCESIGLLKVDFLGLSTLTVMREAARLIEERHGVRWTLDTIPDDAPESYELLSSGEVTGIFQVESAGMRRILADLQPRNFQHVMAVVSLYRPGPIAYIPNFIERLHGREEVTYHHPLLVPILEETYSIIVYQEQIMRIATDLAGYTRSEADFMRKAVAKKKKEDLLKHRAMMMEGAKKKGIPEATMAQIFDDIEAFARYGFPKAHGADYALITVQTAFLKAKYPVEYMAALLLVERDKTEKVINFISECRRMGIQVLPPDVNYSGLDFEIQEVPEDGRLPAILPDPGLAFRFPVPAGSAIRFGMAAVKNVGEGPVRVIQEARKEGGPFASLEDLCDRVDLRQVNKRALECLIKVGALDRFGKRSQLLAVLDEMVARSAAHHNAKESGQLSMFELLGDLGAPEEIPIRLPELEEARGRERLQWEKELLGVYASSHPLQQVKVDLTGVVTCSCAELDESRDGQNVVMAGMIADVRTILTKKGDRMAFAKLEDLQGQCEVVVFPRTFADVQALLVPENVVLVKGKAQTRDGRTSVLADVVQNQVDFVHNVTEERTAYQDALIDVPTFNGKAAKGGLEYPEEAYLDEYGDSMPAIGENPFAHDVPTWFGEDVVEVDGQDYGNPAVLKEGSMNLEKEEDAAQDADPEPVEDAGDRATASGPEPDPGRPAQATVQPAEMPVDAPLPAGGNGHSGDGHSGNGQKGNGGPLGRSLQITLRRSGNLDRDKYRLKEIVAHVRDPRGRDRFFIVLESEQRRTRLAFPHDFCTVSERLLGELRSHFRLEVEVGE